MEEERTRQRIKMMLIDFYEEVSNIGVYTKKVKASDELLAYTDKWIEQHFQFPFPDDLKEA